MPRKPDFRGCCSRGSEPDLATAFEEAGLLVRDGGGFVLDRDAGGRYRLELGRVPIDEVGKRVWVTGHLGADGIVVADGVRLA